MYAMFVADTIYGSTDIFCPGITAAGAVVSNGKAGEVGTFGYV